MSDDEALKTHLRTAQAGFAAMIESIRPALHRYCARMTGSVLDGEDLVQETLAQAFYGFAAPARGAERLSAVTGKAIRYVNVAPDDARQAQLAAGFPPYLADALYELFAERRKGKEATVSPVLTSVFGIRPTRFEEFAARHAAVFHGDAR